LASQLTFHLMGALGVIALLAYLAGRLAGRLGQPPVIGEIALGIVLGPTLVHGAVANALFPTEIRPFLTALANVGVALFMFTVGTEVDAALLRGRRLVAGAVAAGSTVLPFGLGALLALYLLHRHPAINGTGFILFMGAAMSVTAFPVLARILVDRGMSRTWLGSVALACAAIGDALAWIILAVVVAIVGAASGSVLVLLLFLPYVLLMFGVVRPALRWFFRHRKLSDAPPALMLVVTLSGAFASGAFTEWIGLHFIFGAFLFGAVMPRQVVAGNGHDRTADVAAQISQLNGLLLLPIFFIVTGLNVNLSTIGVSGAMDLGFILLVAVTGKFAGAYVAARATGMDNRPAAALAVLMNTRGLTELIILAVGRQLHVLDNALYTTMVVMALVTTAMTGPIMQLLYPTPRHFADTGEPNVEQAKVSG
jgi:Kef-type K+ transport system membrane component KefB